MLSSYFINLNFVLKAASATAPVLWSMKPELQAKALRYLTLIIDAESNRYDNYIRAIGDLLIRASFDNKPPPPSQMTRAQVMTACTCIDETWKNQTEEQDSLFTVFGNDQKYHDIPVPMRTLVVVARLLLKTESSSSGTLVKSFFTPEQIADCPDVIVIAIALCFDD